MIRYNKDWQPYYEEPTTEFDVRFEIDRCFFYIDDKIRHRIRFVKYPNLPENLIKVFYDSVDKNVIFNEETLTYNKNPGFYCYEEELTIKQIWRKYRYDITGRYNRIKKFKRIFSSG